MNRREWLRRAAIIAGGVIAADQIELIERLTPRRYVNGARLTLRSIADSIPVTDEMLEDANDWQSAMLTEKNGVCVLDLIPATRLSRPRMHYLVSA